jgi:hypothetical protein
MPIHTPFELGPFCVDSEGRVKPRDQSAFPAFNVRWRGRSVRAHMAQSEEAEGHLTLRTVMGRIPSTGTGDSAGARPQSFAALRTVQRHLPRGWKMHLLPNHSAVLDAEAHIPLPITAVDLVTEMTQFLLALTPYLDLLDEGGVAAASGIENT